MNTRQTGLAELTIETENTSQIDSLRLKLNEQMLDSGLRILRSSEVKTKAGYPTGWHELDTRLASRGLPCGEISLLRSGRGSGATSVWLNTARLLTQKGRRVAWVETDSAHLHPAALARFGVSPQQVFIVRKPSVSITSQNETRLLTGASSFLPQKQPSAPWLFVLQELLNSNLFDLVGCDLGDLRLPLRESRSLLAQVRRSSTALVIFDRTQTQTTSKLRTFPSFPRELAAVVLEFDSAPNSKALPAHGTNPETNPNTRPDLSCRLTRALHRPVPQTLTRRLHHVDFISGPIDPRFILAKPNSASLSRRALGPGVSDPP